LLNPPTDADAIASRFVAARRSATALLEYPGAKPESLALAYAVQDAAIVRYAAPIAGWKVGRILPPAAGALGVDRLAGPIFAGSVRRLAQDESGEGCIFSGGFGAAEAELVFCISAPPAGQTQFTLDEAAALVEAVFVGIEIASSPYAGINTDGPLVTISDFGNNSGLLIGREISGWRDAAIESWTVSLAVNGTERGQGRASAFVDGPLGSVRFLLETLVARGIALPAGTLISSGAITGVHEVAVGDRVRAVFGEDHVVECTIAAMRAVEGGD
jgi:2-keto-4-pentenoate hydratase